jgi:hypothetical protein
MTDDQVRRSLDFSLTSLIDGMSIPDCILEGTSAVVVVDGGATREFILDQLYTSIIARRQSRNKCALPSEVRDEAPRYVTELCRVVLVNE